MPRRRLGGISSRSSHSLNSGYEALAESVTPVAESALAEAKPEPESVEAKPEPESAKPEPESVEAKPEPEPEPESTTPVIGVSSVDDIDVDK